MQPRLILVCGLPGSGKTTHAKRIEVEIQGIRLCPDEWLEELGFDLWDQQARGRDEALQWKLAQTLLAQNHHVIIEWGTWSRSERESLRAGAQSLGAAVELHFLDAPVQVLFDRICDRKRESPSITLQDLEKWSEEFERPSSEEMALFDSHLLA